MKFFGGLPRYKAVPSQGDANNDGGSSSETTRSERKNFRPVPLQLPFLSSFIVLCGIYVSLIELLLHHTSTLTNSTAETSLVGDAQRPVKRQGEELSTATRFVYTSNTEMSTSTVFVYTFVVQTGTPTTVYNDYYSTSIYDGTEMSTSTIVSLPSSTEPATITPSASVSTSLSSDDGGLSIVTSGNSSYYITTTTVSYAAVGSQYTVIGRTMLVLIPAQTSKYVPSQVEDATTISGAIIMATPASGSTQPPVSQVSFADDPITLVDNLQQNTPTATPTISGNSVPTTSVKNSGQNQASGSSAALMASSKSRSVISLSPSVLSLSSGFKTTFLPSVTTITAPTIATIAPFVSTFTSDAIITLPPQISELAPGIVTTVPSTVLTMTSGAVTTIPESIQTLSSGAIRTLSPSVLTVSSEFVTTFSATTAAATERFLAPLTTIDMTSRTLVVVALTSQYTSFVPTTGADGKLSMVPTLIVQSTTVTTDASAVSELTASVSVSTPEPTSLLSQNERIVRGPFNMGYYFSALYLPAFLAIIIKVLWEIVYAATRLVQPFERLSSQKGVGGRYSVFAQYLSSSLSWDIIRAIGHGNPIPFLAELSYALVQLSTPLATIAMTIKSRSTCVIDAVEVRCDPVWVVNAALLRSIEGVLGICIVCILVIMIMRTRHRSGISSDPSSMGAIATLTNDDSLIRSMQAYAIDSEPTLFEQLLQKQRFKLDDHKAADGQTHYGIVGLESPSNFELTQATAEYQYHAVANAAPLSVNHDISTPASHPPFFSPGRQSSLLDLLGLATPSALLIIVLSYWFDPKIDDLWNRFFASNTAWPKLLLVGLATLASIFLTNIERIVRITEPFRRLNANTRRHGSNPKFLAPPATTILIPRSGTAYSALYQCSKLLLRYELRGGRMSFQFLVAFTVLISDLNIIAAAGIAWSESTTQKSFQISTMMCMILTAFMITTWLIIILWWRRHPAIKVLRASGGANNIAGTMRYISGGGKDTIEEIARMYEEWRSRGSSSRHAGQWGDYRAVFGKHMCSDGNERWCVAFRKGHDDENEVQETMGTHGAAVHEKVKSEKRRSFRFENSSRREWQRPGPDPQEKKRSFKFFNKIPDAYIS